MFHEGKYSKVLSTVVFLVAGTWPGHHVEDEGGTGQAPGTEESTRNIMELWNIGQHS